MVEIKDKHNCCGCSACVQSCPKQCIGFEEDEQGFRYPVVDKSECIDCGVCDTVCPCINPNESKKPYMVFAAKNIEEEVRMKSSSGGVFSVMAEKIINDGGVVFGARFDDNWEVMHDYTETLDGIDAFRGSKYLQSRIGDSYIRARDFLKAGRKVLFSGTGCQISGLKNFLRKDYENLLAVEILCHSVPSPMVWRKYLKEKSEGNNIVSVNFRDKISGWSHYSYSIVINHGGGRYIEPASGLYMKGLTSNLTTRPSCSVCQARSGRSGADVVLGDCWGIWDMDSDLDDNKGVSVVEIMTNKGENEIRKLQIQLKEVQLSLLSKYNSGLGNPHTDNPFHEKFFVELLSSDMPSALIMKYKKTEAPSYVAGLKRFILSVVNRIK